MKIRLFPILLALAVMPAAAGAQQAERAVPQSAAQLRLSYAPVVKQVVPAVVNVYAKRVVRQQGMSMFQNDPFFRRFFGGGFGVPRERVQSSLGSGVIVSPNGIVVTNNHVIENAQEIRIALADRREFEAEIILKDERTDLAVLRAKDTDGATFPHLEFGDSDSLEVGDLVLAIGNPFGVGQTVTSGIVSAVARTKVGVSDYQFFIQTDAAINPGNSGGALVTMDGKLAGINTAIFSRSGGSQGIGFAIPANMVRLVADSAERGEAVRRPWFGASMEQVTSDIADALGMARPGGVLLNEVYAGSPAAQAGLKPGDVVLSIDGFEVADPGSFGFRLATRPLGGTAQIGYLRDGKTRNAEVKMVAPPEDPPREETRLTGRHPLQGATVMNLSPAVADELRLDYSLRGAVIAEVERGSIADRYNLQRGDVVREVNGKDIETVDALRKAMNAASGRWRMSILRGDRVLNVVLGG